VSDQTIPDEPPEETEVFEQYDETLQAVQDDGADPAATGVTGAEGDLSRFTEMPVDSLENEEVGLALDDPQRIATLDGGMDDPDGIDVDDLDPADDEPAGARPGVDPDTVGWDLDAGERP
jgi:hypothetical protein